MFALQSTIIRGLDWLFEPFKRIDPFWALLAVCLVTTFIFLEVFRRTTDSMKLQEAKNSMQARLLEVRLFKDSPSIVLAALAGMLTCNLRYLKHSLKPTLADVASPHRPDDSSGCLVWIHPIAPGTGGFGPGRSFWNPRNHPWMRLHWRREQVWRLRRLHCGFRRKRKSAGLSAQARRANTY